MQFGALKWVRVNPSVGSCGIAALSKLKHSPATKTHWSTKQSLLVSINFLLRMLGGLSE